MDPAHGSAGGGLCSRAWGSAESLPGAAISPDSERERFARAAPFSGPAMAPKARASSPTAGSSPSSGSGTMAMLRSAWDGHVRQGSLRQPLAPAVSLRRSFSRFRESIPGECFRDNRNGATGSRVVARRGAQRVTPGHAKCTPGVEGSRSATGKIGGPGAGPGQGLAWGAGTSTASLRAWE